MKTQRVEHTGPRIETGPVKFGGDWTGVFIRGDEAMNFGKMLLVSLDKSEEHKNSVLRELAGVLMAYRENDK
jgi:hypothetical protein